MTFVRFSAFLFLVFCGIFFFSYLALLNPVFASTPNDPKFSDEWYLQRIGAPKAWDTTTGSSSLIIAILDTGIETTHEDLQNSMWVNSGEIPNNGIDDDGNGYIDDDQGWDFVNNDNNPTDDNGHGTHVAGVAGAATNNSKGVASIGYQAKLMNIKIANSSATTTWANMTNGIYYAVNNGAKIINISFGAPLTVGSSDYNDLHDAVYYAQQHNVLIVAAVGNSGTNMTNLNRDFPAYFSHSFNNVISVAGSNKLDQKYSSSNYGDWVNVAAPAEEIKTTKLNYMSASCTSADGDYCTATLNSYAAPQVAGLAALLLAQHSTWTPDDLIYQIDAQVDEISGTGTYWQYGRINACKAVGRTDCDVQGGLVGYWKMDESSWTSDCSTQTVTDSSGTNNGADCPAYNAPNTTSGKYGNAGSFDGVNDYVDLGSQTALNNQSFTYTAWVKRNSTSGNQGIFAVASNSGTSGGPVFYFNTASKLELAKAGTGVCTTNTALTDTTNWHHIAVTYDGANCRFYIDGSLDATRAWVQTFAYGTNKAFIGAHLTNATLFNGLIDEMRVYNRALSSSEISAVQDPSTATTSGLAGYWPMDESSWTGDCSTGTVLDSSGNSISGKACPAGGGGAVTVAGRYGNAGSFDGINDYVDIGVQPSLQNGAFTYAAWIKRGQLSTNQMIFAIASTSGTSGGPIFLFGTDNKVALGKAGTVGAGCVATNAITDTTNWHHVAVTYDGTNCKVYIDGSVDGSATVSTTFNYGSNHAIIGAHTTTTTFFKGLIDDIRVYNRPLTSTEISTLYSYTP